MLELYHSWFSTCSQKVRLALADREMGLAAMWDDRPCVAGWYARMTARPSFAAACPLQARVARCPA